MRVRWKYKYEVNREAMKVLRDTTTQMIAVANTQAALIANQQTIIQNLMRQLESKQNDANT